MPALVAGVHAMRLLRGLAWMAGTSSHDEPHRQTSAFLNSLLRPDRRDIRQDQRGKDRADENQQPEGERAAGDEMRSVEAHMLLPAAHRAVVGPDIRPVQIRELKIAIEH